MAKVQCYVYDISMGMARGMSMQLVGKQVDVVPHTGIVCWGKEFFYGGGVAIAPWGQAVPIPTCEIIDLGTTTKTERELMDFLQEISPQFTQATYNLLNHNCNHFSHRVAKFLLGEDHPGVPSRIVNIAQEWLSTPQGQALRGFIESFDTQMRQNSAANGLNPFGQMGATNGMGAGAGAGGWFSGNTGRPTGPAVGGMASTYVAPSAAAAAAAAPDMTDLNAALKDIMAVSDVETKRNCLATLVKVCANIADNKEEEKFRKIKTENAAFKKKVAECPGGTECILAVGFMPDEVDGVDYWVFQIENHTNLKNHFLPAVKAKLNSLPVWGWAWATSSVPSGYPSGWFGGPPSYQPNAGTGMGGGGMGMPPGMNLPPGMANNPMVQQMMQNPQMMQQAQQMMNDPNAMAQVQQQLQQNPAMAQQIQQMMNDPQAMQNMMNMMNQGGAGRGPFGR